MKNLFQKSLLVLIGVLITSITTNVWAVNASLYSGDRLYIDCTNWLSDNARIKVNLFGTDGSYQKAVEASQLSGNIYYVDMDGTYNGFQICRMDSKYSTQWNYTAKKWADQRSYNDQYLLTLGSCSDNQNPSWGYGPLNCSTAKDFYYNNSVTQWTTPHLRIGRTNYCTATAMTLEAGTKYLYKCSTGSWKGYEAVCVADKASYTGQGNSIYGKGGGDYLVTGSTVHYKSNITNKVYANATAAGDMGGDGVQYYTTSYNQASSPLPSYSVTVSTKTNCNVTLYKYSTDPDAASPSKSTFSSGSGSLKPTQYIQVVVTPNTGYEFSSLTVSNSGTKTAAAEGTPGIYWINANSSVVAVCSAKNFTISLDNQSATTAGSGSISVTFNATTNLTGSPAITVPAKTGYTFGGYYTDKAGSGVQIIAANGSVVASASGGGNTYTSSTKQWKYNGDITLYAKWTQNITLDREGGETGSTSLSAVYKGVLSTGSITLPTRTGYNFAGYWTGDDGTGSMVINASGVVQTVASWTDSDKKWIHAGSSTLHAKWTPVALIFKSDAATSDWATASNWDPACVPTIEHDVTIKKDATVSGSAVAKSVAFNGGSLTIEPTGVLEVAGAITNTDPDKLIINTNSSNQGALIYDIASPPSAKVYMTTSKTGGDNFQYIASPVGGASVMSTFAGKGVYTYAWIEGKGWDRRGYYEDFSGSEVIVLNGQSGCTFSGSLCPSTGGSLSYTADPENASAQGVNMIPNTLTAPIKIAAMSFSGSSDNGIHIWEDGAWHDYAPASGAAASAVIPALQGYAVLASSSGSVSFDYDVAVRGASNKNAPLGAPKRTTANTPEYMTISVTTNERKIDLQLSEHEQFTNGIDKGWETIYMDGDGRYGQLYAQATDKMSILATPNLEGTILGFVAGESINYTISFEGNGKGYYLNDIVTEQSTLIDEENTYIFSQSENDAARFILSRTPIHNTPTGVDAVNDGVKARKQLINGVLYIIREGRLYDTTGALVK